jgi:uncharacterized membrane protein (DUF485 family)
MFGGEEMENRASEDTINRASQPVQETAEFKQLVSTRMRVSLALTVAMFVAYFGFILVLAYNKEALAQKIGEHVTLGIPIAIGVIVFAWVLTGIYVWWANSRYDSVVQRMRSQLRV